MSKSIFVKNEPVTSPSSLLHAPPAKNTATAPSTTTTNTTPLASEGRYSSFSTPTFPLSSTKSSVSSVGQQIPPFPVQKMSPLFPRHDSNTIHLNVTNVSESPSATLTHENNRKGSLSSNPNSGDSSTPNSEPPTGVNEGVSLQIGDTMTLNDYIFEFGDADSDMTKIPGFLPPMMSDNEAVNPFSELNGNEVNSSSINNYNNNSNNDGRGNNQFSGSSHLSSTTLPLPVPKLMNSSLTQNSLHSIPLSSSNINSEANSARSILGGGGANSSFSGSNGITLPKPQLSCVVGTPGGNYGPFSSGPLSSAGSPPFIGKSHVTF
ncbi:unnamed protein product [Ambrosiozyma monospora]|uniref:Unnamed protein product n=1 Tax=Ambrosiozyma monospora TaxID=43982 RepID=A0ACB5U8T0_AMBMO|nr:unnamed protein product [Ambrosiozyma monospora]